MFLTVLMESENSAGVVQEMNVSETPRRYSQQQREVKKNPIDIYALASDINNEVQEIWSTIGVQNDYKEEKLIQLSERFAREKS